MWYPPSIAPFVAIPHAGVRPDLESAHLQGLGDRAYFVGSCPDSMPESWRIAARSQVLQLFPPVEFPDQDQNIGTILGEADRAAMRELAQVVFPDFFRERTAELGLYLGIHDSHLLIAMAGERMAIEGWQEISGVCTHPDFAGNGHARTLTSALLHRHRRRGVASFLHVSEANTGARRLYESMGFTVRTSLLMCKVERMGGRRPQ